MTSKFQLVFYTFQVTDKTTEKNTDSLNNDDESNEASDSTKKEVIYSNL